MKKIFTLLAAVVLSLSYVFAAQVVLEDLDLNYAQGVYLSNRYSMSSPIWEIDMLEMTSNTTYDVWISFAIVSSSATSIAGTYSTSSMYWAEIDIVNAPGDTTVVNLTSGTLKLTATSETNTYNVVISATGDDGNTYTLNRDITFDYFYDAQTDADITMNENGSSSGSGNASVVLEDLDINFAQGVYLTNYYSVTVPVWEIDFFELIDDNNYSTLLTFAIETASATSVAGTYDISDTFWAVIELVNGTDTTEIALTSGTLTIARVADEYAGYYTYRVTVNAQDANGNSYTLQRDITFDYFYDALSDEDIDMTDEIGTGLEVVAAQDMVKVVDGQLLVNGESNVQIYNVAGQMLYNGAGNSTVNGIQHGQTLIIRSGNKAAKVVY